MKPRAILRRWSSRIRTADEDAYGQYVLATGLTDYAATAGNLGAEILMRRLGDGTTEVTTLSWWRSMEAIEAIAGEQPELARYYPEDDRFLIEKPKLVEHHVVIASSSGADRSTIEPGKPHVENSVNY